MLDVVKTDVTTAASMFLDYRKLQCDLGSYSTVMLPEPSKGKKPESKENDKVQKTDKRRNSLTDSSTFSTSTSSNSSSVDSDEAAGLLGALCESKGTMTVPAENLCSSPADENTKDDFDQYRRAIRTNTSPAEECRRRHGFRSIADDVGNDFANNEKQPVNGETAASVRPAIYTRKRAEKQRKEREKLEKKERDRAAAIQKRVEEAEASRQAAILASEKERLARDLLRKENRRGQHKLGPVHYGTSSVTAPTHSSIEPPRNVGPLAKLQASIGFGIAATGVYDYYPRIVGARVSKPSCYYSDQVGPWKENWRESYQDSYLREHNHVGTLYVAKDALEGVAKSMEQVALMVNSPFSNKWLKKLLQLVLKGKVRKVWRRMQIIGDVLRRYKVDYRCNFLGLTSMIEFVMQGITNLTRDTAKNTNVIMYLSSQFSERKPCFLNNHRQCLMIDFILHCLAPSAAHQLISERSFVAQQQAVHFAAISGHPCQLNVLLSHGTSTNEFDQSKQAPVHYLVERNNVLMVRQLMWYGSDMSLLEQSASKVPSELYNVDNAEVCTFLQLRMKALERVMASWLRAICAGKLQLGCAASLLHSMRFLEANGRLNDVGHPRTQDLRKIKLALRRDVIEEARGETDHLVVFMLPVAFTPQDVLMPAECPHIVRRKMYETYPTYQLPSFFMQNNPTMCLQNVGDSPESSRVFTMLPVFRETHNGYLYAWRLPYKGNQLKGVESAIMTCTVDVSKINKAIAEQSMMFVQMFVVKSTCSASSKQKVE
ncbi:hypothetical protein Y032_0680g1474 [Ancylostoma ceylanicum]|uniref:Uncharacterized protein n=1 Tax=Ancylostoma ceylanicum TaxID=53326 RepID=A0A016WHI6_9BILA|nr:hypothetical protein Y032_0680g1474 [Ancylostoma ceylanicum]